MMKFLLDTSALIEYARGDEEALKAISDVEGVLTSALCSYELLVGSSLGKKPKLERLLAELTPLPFTFRDSRRASVIFKLLTRQGEIVNVVDILIFAQAMERGLGIITKDNDFQKLNNSLKCNIEIILL